LVISYLSPRFFTLLVLAGDAQTALRWGGPGRGPSHTTREAREFLVSDEALFCEVFDVGRSGGATWPVRVLRLLPATVHGYGRVAEDRQNGHPLAPEGWMGQVGFSMLLCSLVAIEWAEELLWRIARVRWAVTESMHTGPDAMVAS
jgi:hypothetical protein